LEQPPFAFYQVRDSSSARSQGIADLCLHRGQYPPLLVATNFPVKLAASALLDRELG
jgi:hypothetical protein